MKDTNEDAFLETLELIKENDRLNNFLNNIKNEISSMSIFLDFCTNLLKITDIEKAISIIVIQMCKIVNSSSIKFLTKKCDNNNYCLYSIEKDKITKKTLIRDELGNEGLFIYCTKLKIGDESHPFLALPIKHEGENLAVIKFENVDYNQVSEININLLELLSVPAGVTIKNCILREEALMEKKAIDEKNNRIEQDLKYAQKVQNIIIPSGYHHIDQYLIYGNHEAAEYLGGDFYEVFKTIRGNILFYMADISGHGIATALLTIFFKEKINEIIMELVKMEIHIKPFQVLKKLQDLFVSLEFNTELYIGIILGTIDVQNNIVTIANAGHNVESLKIRDNTIIPIEIKGLPINNWFGLEHCHDYEEKSLYFDKGDNLIFLSDGAVESTRNGNILGINTVKDILFKNRHLKFHEQYDVLVKEVKNFSEKNKLDDDIAFLAIKRI